MDSPEDVQAIYATRDRLLTTDAGESYLPDPKSDVYFGFPMYEDADLAEFPGFVEVPQVKNFMKATLQSLHKNQGLLASLLSYKNKMCFPWAIMEAKKTPISKSEKVAMVVTAEDQLAGGVAAALELLVRLARNPDPSAPADTRDPQVPPVVGFTTIGPQWTMYLGYVTTLRNGRTGYVSFCF